MKCCSLPALETGVMSIPNKMFSVNNSKVPVLYFCSSMRDRMDECRGASRNIKCVWSWKCVGKNAYQIETICRLRCEKEFRLQSSSIQFSDFVHVVLLGVQRPGLDTCFWFKCSMWFSSQFCIQVQWNTRVNLNLWSKKIPLHLLVCLW